VAGNFACNLPRKVVIAAMTATIYFRRNRSLSQCSSIARAAPQRKPGIELRVAFPIVRRNIQRGVVLGAPSTAKRFALAKLIPVVSPVTTAISSASLRAMTCLLIGEADLWWAYHSKIEYPANHRCRIADVEAAGCRAGDVRQGGGGAILYRGCILAGA
jgi:hypothetical protein